MQWEIDGLFMALRLFPQVQSYSFYVILKTVLFRQLGTGTLVNSSLKRALYKCSYRMNGWLMEEEMKWEVDETNRGTDPEGRVRRTIGGIWVNASVHRRYAAKLWLGLDAAAGESWLYSIHP